jgi:hypothetical protein
MIQDWRHFALYEANQKAYEATFLKEFVKHALQPSQLEQCVEDSATIHPNVLKYISSISTSISTLTSKMTWNAHSGVVNLLANDGQDGAPFWDVTSLDRRVFDAFDPDKPALIARKMDASWHRSTSKPSMVLYASKDYPIGQYGSPLENIDDVSDTLFNQNTHGSSLPAGRPIKHPVSNSKGKGLPGTRTREPVGSVHRNNWLASLVPVSTEQPDKLDHGAAAANTVDNDLPIAEPKMHSERRFLHDEGQHDTRTEVVQTTAQAASSSSTTLEQLFEDFGSGALSGHDHMSSSTSIQQQVTQVSAARWLLTNHKGQLAPQMVQRALPGIRAALIEASLQGCLPVGHHIEEHLNDIERQEQAKAARLNVDQQARVIEHSQQEAPMAQCSNQGKKRRRNQPPSIRMVNRPVEPSKRRKRNAQAVSASVDASGAATDPAQQNAPDNGTHPTADQQPLPPHPSGSSTLEAHQKLPPDAYFQPKSPSEKPVWRCGIKHPMGYYYNAGNRKNCPGCFCALSDNPKAKTMDFYLPSRTYSFQPEPDSNAPWRPSKSFLRLGRARLSTSSHNSIGKDAYWAAVASGVDTAAAMSAARDAVTQHLASKIKKEPTPPPTPEPEPDLGPHPSGSKTMEHGQSLPTSATFTRPNDRHVEFAWRCDVNHALGRYYLAGERRCCPGCGSNKTGSGKKLTMDFYLPMGVFVRQKVDGAKWTPKKPYKTREGKENEPKKENKFSTHNQYASRMYWKAMDKGLTAGAALKSAIAETDKWVDGREEDAELKSELRKAAEEKKTVRRTAAAAAKVEAKKPRAKKTESKGGVKGKKTQLDISVPTSSLALNALRAQALSNEQSEVDTDDEYSDSDEGESHEDEVVGDGDAAEDVEMISSDDESSSSSEEE